MDVIISKQKLPRLPDRKQNLQKSWAQKFSFLTPSEETAVSHLPASYAGAVLLPFQLILSNDVNWKFLVIGPG